MNYNQNRNQNPNFNQNPNPGQSFEVICYSCNTPRHTSSYCNKQININQQLPQQAQQEIQVNTSQVKLNKEDNILTESNTDDDEEEAPHMNLYCNEELNQKEIDSIKFVNDSEDFKIYEKKPQSRKIDENNPRESEQTTNGKNLIKNKDYQGNYYKFKYKINDDENIDIGNFRGNKQILTKDRNFFKNNKGEECNSGMNYEDIKKGKVYEIYKGTEQLNK